MAKEQGEARQTGTPEKKIKVYVTKAGDSLSKIAKKFYGDADRWQEIFEANKGKIQDPDKISVGLELRIP
jgi:nucleoid-associated protein YgaU